ncbi:MAG TPA: phosphatase domain-containing protein [Labilithrix sp.]|nr:phosphatase domain-containing protein [Labilithrix sp.]
MNIRSHGVRFSLLASAALSLAACAGTSDDSPSTESAAVTTSKVSTFFVSDIDDTIKATGIHSLGVVKNALSTTNEFAGMSILYASWHAIEPKTKQITYLSAAPGPAINLGISFLQASGFPGDSADVSDSVVGGRRSESAGQFKGSKLIAMYDAAVEKPATMILVGDNGEQDMIAYATLIDHVKSAGGTTKVYSFIHHVYESAGKATPIASPHRAFLTAADLAVQFYNAAWIDEAALTKVLNEVAHDSGKTHDLTDTVVPSFMECGRFTSWPVLDARAGTANVATYATVKSNTKELCR